MLKTHIEPRLYQQTIFNSAATKNTLVVLPTGMGKTLIAELLTVHRLQSYPESKVIFMAPTKPLAQQHLDTFRRDLDLEESQTALFTGNVTPAKRAKLWEQAKIVFTTPQGLENDVLSERILLKDVSLLIVDEAHRAIGEYAYVFLAERYHKQAAHERILALTASPGSDKVTIEEVCRNLYIEEIEVRSGDSPDVQPYIQQIDIEHIPVKMPEQFKTCHDALTRCKEQRLDDLQTLGLLHRSAYVNKTLMLKAQASLHLQASRGQKDYETLKSMSLLAEVLKVEHAIELLETQGVAPLIKYFDKLQSEAAKGQSKAVQHVVIDVNFKAAMLLADRLKEQEIEHPKLRAVQKAVLKEVYANKSAKIIIFNQYRDQAVRIKEALDQIHVAAKIFVGQMKKGDTGMTQKEQHKILEEFRAGEFTCLIATSVAEEGLDIPKVDIVIFYEPVPSAIRTVQRRGRTGRLERGRIIMLVTEGTRDVAYKHVAKNKEKRMYRVLDEVRRDFISRNGAMIAKDEKSALVQQSLAESTSKKTGNKNKTQSDEEIATSKIENQSNKTTVSSKETKNENSNDTSKEKPIINSEDAKRTVKSAPEVDDRTIIVADHREKASGVLKSLVDMNAHLRLEQLKIGDYMLSDRVVVEYKTVPDFVDSIIDGRLLMQLRSLRAYPRPIIIVEGEEDIYGMRKVHQNSILGMLAAITVSYNIPVLFTKNSRETAALLLLIARKEQEEHKSDFQYHAHKGLTDLEQQESVIAALPGVGSTLAKHLLMKFRSIEAVANATEEQLAEVEKIGPKKAKQIYEIIRKEYRPEA